MCPAQEESERGLCTLVPRLSVADRRKMKKDSESRSRSRDSRISQRSPPRRVHVGGPADQPKKKLCPPCVRSVETQAPSLEEVLERMKRSSNEGTETISGGETCSGDPSPGGRDILRRKDKDQDKRKAERKNPPEQTRKTGVPYGWFGDAGR